jgi:hypothetical protein
MRTHTITLDDTRKRSAVITALDSVSNGSIKAQALSHLESIGLLLQQPMSAFSRLFLPLENLLVHTRRRDS